MISRRAKAQVAQAVNCPSRICFYSFAHIPRMLLAWFAPLGFQVSSFCQLIFRRWRAQGAQAVNWTSRICFHGFAHIPNILFAWCVPLGFQVSSFVNWYLGGGGHNLHSLWTVLRGYVFIASAYPSTLLLSCAPLGPQISKRISAPEDSYSIVNYRFWDSPEWSWQGNILSIVGIKGTPVVSSRRERRKKARSIFNDFWRLVL